MSYVVDFEPGLHGPFQTEEEANQWVSYVIREWAERNVDHGWRIVELGPPDIVPDGVLPPHLRRRGLLIDGTRSAP